MAYLSKNRNAIALPAKKKKAGKMQDRRRKRAGAKNHQREYLEQSTITDEKEK